MSFDALAMHAVRDELEATLLGGQVEKVVPLSPLEVGFRIRSHYRDFSLLMSADSQSARIHLVRGTLRRLSDEVTPFLLLLRKYVGGGRIVAVEQPALERVIKLIVENRLENDETTPSQLIIEAMGRHSNVILVGPDGKVLDAIKRVPPSLSRQRPVLPHLPYLPPPPVEKLSPLSPLLARQLAAAARQVDPSTALWRFLQDRIAGLGPLSAREVVHRAEEPSGAAPALSGRPTPHDGMPEQQGSGPAEEPACAEKQRAGDSTHADVHGRSTQPTVGTVLGSPMAPAGGGITWQAVEDSLARLYRPIQTREWSPCIVRQEGTITHFAPYLLTQFPESQIERVASISEALERAYAEELNLRPAEALRAPLREALQARLDRVRRKEDSLRGALSRSEGAELLMSRGRAILSSVAQIRPGQTELRWENTTIALDPKLSPAENAQRYFKDYAKARDAARELPALLHGVGLERQYLEQMLVHIELAEGEVELRGLSREIAEITNAARTGQGPVPMSGPPKGGRRPEKPKANQTPGAVKRFNSSEGHQILVGGSARGNERVTFELGGGGDLWLHARGVPGAHVVVKLDGRELPPATLLEAARLAALNSQARGSSKVPVDYTLQRYVKKVKGGPPGLVTYSQERTIRVDATGGQSRT